MESENRIDWHHEIYVKQAAALSGPWSLQYQQQHALQDPADRTRLAEARLHFVLAKSRRELSGLFTEGELFDLLSCFQGELLDPPGIEDMPGALLDDHPENAELAEKVAQLTTAQRLGLADLIEQIWHRHAAEECTPQDIAAKLQVALA
jgi:hypothetical protein